MKKQFLFLLLMLPIALGTMAQNAWTVKTVPNTRLENDSIHVSDPEGYLSDSVEMNINNALCAIRNQADVFVVTLSSIGRAEPKSFATDLFNYWGIGDAETNNGVLLLFVEDQHALEFETGYGAEEVLTDAKCQSIFTKTIVPFFKAGDYEGGLCAGVGEIVKVYGGVVPDGLVSTHSGQIDEDGTPSNLTFLFGLVILLVFFIPLVSFIRWLAHIKDKKRLESNWEKSNQYEENGVTYISDYQNTWSGSPWEGQGCLRAMTFGHSLLVVFFVFFVWLMGKEPEGNRALYNMTALGVWLTYTTVICFFQNMRSLRIAKRLSENSLRPKAIYKAAKENMQTRFTWVLAPWLGILFYFVFKKKEEKSIDLCCPTCKSQVETDSSFLLPEIKSLEERLQAMNYTPYRCIGGHQFVMQNKGEKASNFKTCDQCGAFTLNRLKTETKVKASTSSGGIDEETYLCQNCGYSKVITVKTPRIYVYSSGGSSSSSRSSGSSSYHSSSRSSGGSFGGGRSGGGGFSGRW